VLKVSQPMSKSPFSAAVQTDHHWLPWLPDNFAPVHADFSHRVVSRPDQAIWQPSAVPGLLMHVLDYVPGEPDRLTALFRLTQGSVSAAFVLKTGVEMLITKGELQDEINAHRAGWYLRVATSGTQTGTVATGDLCFRQSLNCKSGNAGSGVAGSNGGAGVADAGGAFDEHRAPAGIVRQPAGELYLATGHLADTDAENRRINTRDESRWLPGPIDGTEVMPLHGHGSSSALLVRWQEAAEFQPRLDPLGEEVYVLAGVLHDDEGTYPAGSWIRNPVPSWQSWAGKPGTVIYYKSGHFGTSLDESS